MKYKTSNYAKPNTTYLQGCGHVVGTPAGELNEGDTILMNDAFPEKIISIIKETKCTISVMIEYMHLGKVCAGTQKFHKGRIVARPLAELPIERQPGEVNQKMVDKAYANASNPDITFELNAYLDNSRMVRNGYHSFQGYADKAEIELRDLLVSL
jgi:hypothetical protein